MPLSITFPENLPVSARRGEIMAAIEQVLVGGPRTPDMGGTASTVELGRAIAAALEGRD